MPVKHKDQLTIFYELSVLLTGFDETDLLGTGVGHTYFDKLVEGAGENNVSDLLEAVVEVRGSVAQFRRRIWDDEDGRFSPITRNILLMWYLGSWLPLPEEWHETFGNGVPLLEEQVISPTAYKTGLVWRVIGAHAPGADPPGFGSWSTAPGVIGGGASSTDGRETVSKKATKRKSRKKSSRG